MNLFTFGCSFTKDNYQKTWADITAENLGVKLINRAERGSGADYLTSRLLNSIDIDPAEDLVLIMWPSCDRYDLWADRTTPHLLNDIETCSWPDGRLPKLVDYHGKYNHESGFILNGSMPRGHKHKYFKYFYSADQSVNNWLSNIVLAQLYLNNKKISYVMSSAFPLRNPIHFHHDQFSINDNIYSNIDLSKFVADSEVKGFYKFCHDLKLPFLNPNHPASQSHAIWVEQILLPKVFGFRQPIV